MRWLFLLLLVLNTFYWLWHQQQTPLRAREISPLELVTGGAAPIRLLNEVDEQAPPSASVQGNPPAEVAPGVCLFIGGFSGRDAQLALGQRLNGLDIAAEPRTLETVRAVDYWVYLPPLESRDAALRQLRELQAREVEAYLIGEGAFAGGLSLGSFSRPEPARKLLDRVRALGYRAEMREQPRSESSYWLRLSASQRPLLGDALLVQLVRDFPTMRQELLSCESVATP